MRLDSSTIQERLQLVESRIQRALDRSGRKRSELTLVAVSKKFSAERIREAYEAGIRSFGENYVQEFKDKKPFLVNFDDAKFHLIGHLQSNKVRLACTLFDVVQTADTVHILQRLNAAASERRTRLEAFLEIKLSDEVSKSGAGEDAIPELLEAGANLPYVNITGLMTMPPWSAEAENSRPFFRRLASLARKYGVPNVSMGMSGDFEVAIEEGATVIRVGTALFGARPTPATPA